MSTAISVIISSYNQPNALTRVFAGLACQTRSFDEVVVADDGSGPETRAVAEAAADRYPWPVHFVTQPDEGFRKSMALNRGIRKSSGELVLFLDGDSIPYPTWAAVHAEALEGPYDYACGGYVGLSLEQASALTPETISRETLDPLLTATAKRRFRWIHLKQKWYLAIGRKDKPKIRGCNFSATRAALERVNGFDENYDGFGKEDSDIRNRLNNAGMKGASVWNRAFVFHCDHGLDPARPEIARGRPDWEYYRSVRDADRAERGLDSNDA
jgi:glycosyltransferase involved in cell wall biosynthesis